MSAIGPVTAHHTEDGRVCVHVVVTDFVQGAASGDLGPGHAVPELPTGTHGTGARLRNISAQVEGIELLAVRPDGFEGTIPELVGLMTSAASPATGREPFGGAETGSTFRHRPRHQRGTRDHSC